MTESVPFPSNPLQPTGALNTSPSAGVERPESSGQLDPWPGSAPGGDQPPRPRWYVAVFEATGWMFGTLVVQLAGAVFVSILLYLIVLAPAGKSLSALQGSWEMLVVTGGSQLIFAVITIVAVALRYWGRPFAELNFSQPDARHLLIVVCGTLPLSMCVSVWSMPIQAGWRSVTERFPDLKLLDDLNTMRFLNEVAHIAPLPVLVLILAVVPAVAEELIFRGAIGRVLIASLGIWSGVILTSFLFGWIHIHPVHALSVIPLGVALHLVYLFTRSLWLPMLLHLLNNCWALIAAQLETGQRGRHWMYQGLIDGTGMISAVVAVAALGLVLWQSRIRLLHADGREWKSGYYPLRVASSVTIRREAGEMNNVCWNVAVISAFACHLAMVIDLMNPVVKPN